MTKKLSYVSDIQVHFNHSVVNYLCGKIDNSADEVFATTLKKDLLHIISNTYDLASPLCKLQLEAFNKVKVDML